MEKLNVSKLLYETPNISIHFLKESLGQVFPSVTTRRRNEVFFNFEICCFDDYSQLRLTIRYGWSVEKNSWVFETLPARSR